MSRVIRILVVGLTLSALVLPAALAAALAEDELAPPVTDNLFPILVGPWPSPDCLDDPDGGDGDITCQTDNATVTWYTDSHGEFELENVDFLMVKAVTEREFDRTDLKMVHDPSPTFTGGSETDIVYQEGSRNLDDSSDGVTWCDDATDRPARFKCDQQYVRIRGNGHYTDALTCHETGHAIGLLHGSESRPELSDGDDRLGCMTTPAETGDLRRNQRRNINIEWNEP